MTTFVNPLKPRGGTRYSEALSRLKAWTRAAIAAGEGDDDPMISVTELACAEPGCPPRETVILIMWSDRPIWKLRIHKSMTDVANDDVLHAAQSPEVMKRAGA